MKIERGKEFEVEIHEDYVVKTPIDKRLTEEKMKEIADFQNFLAKHIPEILPIEVKDGKMIEPRAKGQRADEIYKEYWTTIRKKRDKVIKRIKRLGYMIHDSHRSNIFYDIENDKITMIDFTRHTKLDTKR